MRRFRIVALSTSVTLATGIAVAIAGTPFGGDDIGTIPSDSPKGPVTTCESKVAKATSKLVASIVKCHVGRTSGKFTDDVAEDTCEGTAITKFEATKTAGCAGCTDLFTPAAIFEVAVDFLSAGVYCDATGTPFGGDDLGSFVPPDAPKGPETKCSNGVNKAVGKLFGALTKCHIGLATGKFPDDTAEDACEGVAKVKFIGTTKTAGCPLGCMTPLPILATAVEQAVDNNNDLIWCGSPSGAFLNER